MEIEARMFSCNKETYKQFYKKAIVMAYQKDHININENDIKPNWVELAGDSIQAQRAPNGNHSRTISVFENGKIKYIIGISNTNYDLDKKLESERLGKRSTYGVPNYHSNTYLYQGINKIFEYYFDTKANNKKVKLFFYLLDTDESYPKNKSNLVTYRKLATLGFEILNVDDIDFQNYEEMGNVQKNDLAYKSFNKFMNDMLYVSKRNEGNVPAYLQCVDMDYDISKEVDNDDEIYASKSDNKKYIYTFKTLGAEAYDSFITMWTLIELAQLENKNLEFLFSQEKFNFRLGQEHHRFTQDFPETITRLFEKIGLDVHYETSEERLQQFEREKNQYEISKRNNVIRNQELFKNNIRAKGVPTKCCLCGCEIEDILEAAHLWGVSEINSLSPIDVNNIMRLPYMQDLIDETNPHKRETFYKKYIMANSGDNGVWLCSNHHGLFDSHHYCFDSEDGRIILYFNTEEEVKKFLVDTVNNDKIPRDVLTEKTKRFLAQRKLVYEYKHSRTEYYETDFVPQYLSVAELKEQYQV